MGAAMGNIAIGLAVGIAVGIVIGQLLEARRQSGR
jgi:hypothetical protein